MAAPEHERHVACCGTDVRILLGPSAAPGAPAPAVAAHRATRRLKALHAALTRFSSTSELSRLNTVGAGVHRVSPLMAEALAAALWAAEHSGGLVDPTLLDALEHAGYRGSRIGKQPASLAQALRWAPSPRRPAAPCPENLWRQLRLDRARHTVRVPAGVKLDLGGSAKGLAVDLVAEDLNGLSTYAVDAGGDLRLGGVDAAPRGVLVAHPLRGDAAATFTLTAGAVATSGLDSRLWRTETGFAHHLLDPSTGHPAWTGVIQATALARTALEAETLAKTALLAGPLAGRRLLARQGGVLTLDNGRVITAGPLPPSSPAPPPEKFAA